ncbi:sigma-E factor regulatory protein RseB domain-containing protein [Escherichia coli]
MKQLWFAMSLVTGSLLFSANASATPASGALLQQMNLASQSLNYELSFISINKQGVESLRYRHARLDNRPLAQLLQMDGPRREVVQRGNEISYFEPGLEPFTLNGDYIVPRFYVSTSKSIIKALINMHSFEIQLSPIG